MTLEQLRIFVAVALREHVTLGARDLNLTQSATSAAIAALESRHATKLFDRVGRRIVLTEAGRVFLAEAKAVLARANAAEMVLGDLGELKRGRLQIAASQTIANYWLPHHIHTFHSRFPGVEVHLTIGNTTTVAADVRDGNVDLGFVEGDTREADVTIERVADDELILVAPPNHPWAKMPPVSSELASESWILREAGSGTRAIFEDALPRLGLRRDALRVVLELPSNEAVRSTVEAGAGVTVMSRLVVQQAIAAGALAEVALPITKRGFYVLRHRERYMSRAAMTFYEGVADMALNHIR
jgi:DNA-binding transcriptional LysR family regulator